MKKSIISLILLLSFPFSASAASEADLQSDAPERYVVVPGDTLWTISNKYLKDAWRWPELWKMNKDELRNPHRIYPGDVLVLDRTSSGQVAVRLAATRVGPRARLSARGVEPIRTIPVSAIEPFLSKPLVVTVNELDSAPQIIATEEDRVVLGAGNIAYAQGLTAEHKHWQIFRRGDPLVDPETNETLGYVASYLGEAEVVKSGDVSTLRLTRTTQEVVRGDKLVPLAKETPVFSYAPRPPEGEVAARIMSTYGGLSETGPLSIVTISKGTRDGVEPGTVLALYRDPRSSRYAMRTQPVWGRTGPTGSDAPIAYYPAEITPRDVYGRAKPIRQRDLAKLPSERYGLVMVFRSFERASFALVMEASRPVAVADIVANP